MTNKTLLYIGKPGGAVFEAQVIQLLIELKNKKYFDRVILLAGVVDNEKSDLISSLRKRTGLEVKSFKLYPNYHFYRTFQKKALKEALKNILEDNTVIHTRGETFSQVIKPIVESFEYRNIKILTDIRGAVFEETLIYNKLKPVQFQLKLYQHKKNLKSLDKNTDYISCVSDKLKEYILQRVNIDKNKIFINHCMAGANFIYSESIRQEYRDKLKLGDNDILFVFATGDNRNWQNTGDIINNIAAKGYKVLNLSKSKIERKNVINLFVPHSEVPKYLNAADIAVIWRKDDVVNNVASPVKFSEYVCSGLPIIANNGVDLINKYVGDSGNGKIIEKLDSINPKLINYLRDINRTEISSYADKYFSSKVILQNYLKIYKKLLNH